MSLESVPLEGRFALGHQLNGRAPSLRAVGVGEGGPTVVCTSSAGKQMTAACAGLLVLQGLLVSDVPIRRYLPELPRWADPIRLHHLIHHTSGLPDKAVWDMGFSGGFSGAVPRLDK